MALTEEQIYQEAISLSDDEQEKLAEKLLSNVASHIDPEVEQAHLEVIRQRKDEMRSGQVKGIDGQEILDKVRKQVGL